MNLLTRFRLLCVLLLVISCSTIQAEHSITDNIVRKIDALVDERVSWSDDAAAYSILVDQAGSIVYERHVGFANIEHRIPAGRKTVYRIGSITKSYTALAILQLVEKDFINLETEVFHYLPKYTDPGARVTIRQLLTHTSGIPSFTALPDAQEVLTWKRTSRAEIFDLFKDLPLLFEPGSQYEYSNSGYYLLGLIIESVSGMDYFKYVRENIFQPLELVETYTGDLEEIVPERAEGYVAHEEGFSNAPPVFQITPFSAGALEASAKDLVKYRRQVFRSPAISENVRSQLLRTYEFSDGTRQHYALGAVNVADFHGHKRLRHDGSISGFSSNHDYFPDEDITVVVLINANGAPISPQNMSTKIEREIFLISQPENKTVDVPQSALDIFAGSYQTKPFRLLGEHINIISKEGGLSIQVNEDDENPMLLPLLSRSQNEFVAGFDDELFFQFSVVDAKVVHMSILKSGVRYLAKRISDVKRVDD